jgi:hypothetical protein
MEHRLIADSRISLFYLDSEDKWKTKPGTGIEVSCRDDVILGVGRKDGETNPGETGKA